VIGRFDALLFRNGQTHKSQYTLVSNLQGLRGTLIPYGVFDAQLSNTIKTLKHPVEILL
jgi:hypothetical protein